MATVQTKDPTPSFETVWAILQETAKRQAEADKRDAERKAEFEKRQAEYNKRHEESKAEYEKRQAEYEKRQAEYAKRDAERKAEFDLMMKKSKEDFDRRLGNLTNLFGDFTESMVAPALRDKLQDFGFDFETVSRNVSIRDKENKPLMEIDVLLENGDKVMLIEIKTKLTVERINYHIGRLEKMRVRANQRGDKRAFLGGIAGVVVPDDVRNYALSQGLYLIEPAGETFNITPPIGKPKEW